MFEGTKRSLPRLDGSTGISATISHDEDDCFDRQCPSDECQFQFKLLLQDWKAKVRDEEEFCPFCGHTADATESNSEEQTEHLTLAAIALLRSTMGKTLRRDADLWDRRQPRDSFISIVEWQDNSVLSSGIVTDWIDA